MNIEIISIGDELLIGQTINTNAAWMGQELNNIGMDISQVSVIPDTGEAIIRALDDALKRVDVVLITGGLGPTKDDITKTTLAHYFNTALIENPDVLKGIEERLKARNLEMNELNRMQALVPENARIFSNKWGTAPGMWFKSEGKIVVSLPGVPAEMKGLMTRCILPELQSAFNPGHILHRTILIIGTIEARLAQLLESFEERLPKELKLAYLPTSPVIKLRFSARGPDKNRLEQVMEQSIRNLYKEIPDLIFGEEPESLEQIIGNLLMKQRKTLATAESCTGGDIARTIVSVPGSSKYFIGSVIAYSDNIKINTLGVKPDIIENEGAVSESVVHGMALGIQRSFGADYAIAVSGIAGPGGGTEDKPVGTTWIAIGIPGSVSTYKFTFGNERDRNIHRATMTALDLLRKNILKSERR